MVIKIAKKLVKTEEMEKFEEETGKEAIWHGEITDAFKKWQRGEKVYNVKKQRISLYVSDGIKDEWNGFIKDNSNHYSTISKLIRDAVKFFIKYQSKIEFNYKGSDIDLISALSHELKEPLTSIKGNIQLIIKTYRDSIDNDLISMLERILSQCETLEERIVKLEKIEKKNSAMDDGPLEYDILLIEDDNETVNLLTSYFEMEGFSCKGILEGNRALEELTRFKPKLILLDILLPDISGYEIIKKIRLEKRNSDLPIFFLSAIPETEVAKKTKELKANGYILKPFNLSDFEKIFNYLQ